MKALPCDVVCCGWRDPCDSRFGVLLVVDSAIGSLQVGITGRAGKRGKCNGTIATGPEEELLMDKKGETGHG